MKSQTSTKHIIYDIEVYPNKFCIGFKELNKPAIIWDDLTKIATLPFDDPKYLFIGFNNRNYDQPIIDALKRGLDEYDLFELSKSIIAGDGDFFSFSTTIIDLYAICPKVAKCSLKEFGHRLKYPTLENLPYPYDQPLTDEQWAHVKRYCEHDLNITEMLWHKLEDEYDARQNLKCFFDIKTEFAGAPKLAEKAILSRLGEQRISYDGALKKQANMRLSEPIKAHYNTAFDFGVGDYGTGLTPAFMDEKINIKGCDVKIGVGGLHGISEPGFYENVYDYDVISYYPSIILNCKLGSDPFRHIYQTIYDERLKLKQENHPHATSLKLILNSIFGKMADLKYSDPKVQAFNLNLSICLLGQFYLIDLIEKCGYGECLLANTDGIFTRHPIPDDVLNEWQARTQFTLTCKKYTKFILKDVNAYWALDGQGEIKAKKEFIKPDWTHNTRAYAIAKLAINKIVQGWDFDKTLQYCTIWDFLFFTKTTGGRKLILDSEPLSDPKIRWYCATEGHDLYRQRKDGILSFIVKSSKIKLAMNIKEGIPADLNVGWYKAQADKLVKAIMGDIGC